MQHKHTPHPWYVVNQVHIFTGLGADSGDGCNASPNDGWLIADCSGALTNTEIGQVELGLDVVRANARLIAAAPELFDLVDSANGMFGCHTVNWQKRAEQVIARIKGAQP